MSSSQHPRDLYLEIKGYISYQIKYKRGFAKKYFAKIMRLRNKNVRDKKKFIMEIILGFQFNFFANFQEDDAYCVLAEYLSFCTREYVGLLDFLVLEVREDPVIFAMCQVSRYMIGITATDEQIGVRSQFALLEKHGLSSYFENKVRFD